MRTSIYLSGTKLFKAVRKFFKIEKPYALGLDEWANWDKDMKKANPIGFFFTESLPDFLDTAYRLTFGKMIDMQRHFGYRYWNRYNILKTGLKPGYYDYDTRIMHALFQSLVDYVEIEVAHMQIISHEESLKKYGKCRNFFGNKRCKEAGLEHLYWEMTLDSVTLEEYQRCDAQAITAREKFSLYQWWTEIRPKRPDPHDASGWTDIVTEIETKYGSIFSRNISPDLAKRKGEALDKCVEIELEYDKEDEEMIRRLINIRKSLWT
jgi:hypothetical protein